MPKALITGSGGLIGSECAALLCRAGWDVVGLDNDLRSQYFGPGGSVAPTIARLGALHRRYRHMAMDIRDRQGIRRLFQSERPEFVVHTAAQPSHE
jgi:CDP-paratose 2-epimerase